MATTDAELSALMRAALAGDATAYRALLGDVSTRLTAFYRRRVSDRAAADDLVQDCLLAIHAKRDMWDPAQPLLPWVYAIARYKLVDHFRRSGHRATVPLTDIDAFSAPDATVAADARADVERALAQLPARTAALVRDVRLRELSVADAGARAGLSEGAAKVAMHRALKRLRTVAGRG